VFPEQTVVDPQKQFSNDQNRSSGSDVIKNADDVSHDSDLKSNLVMSSDAYTALILEALWQKEAIVSGLPAQVPWPFVAGKPFSDFGKSRFAEMLWSVAPKHNGLMRADCAFIENTGIATALKLMDSSVSDGTSILTALVSDASIYHIQKFFESHIDFFEDTGTVVLAKEDLGFTHNFAKKNLISNPQHIFQMLQFSSRQSIDRRTSWQSSTETSKILSRCFSDGTCIMRVHVLPNSFWEIGGGWDTFLHVSLSIRETSLTKSFRSILPRIIDEHIPSDFPAMKQEGGFVAHLGNLTATENWALTNFGSLMGLSATCVEAVTLGQLGMMDRGVAPVTLSYDDVQTYLMKCHTMSGLNSIMKEKFQSRVKELIISTVGADSVVEIASDTSQ